MKGEFAPTHSQLSLATREKSGRQGACLEKAPLTLGRRPGGEERTARREGRDALLDFHLSPRGRKA